MYFVWMIDSAASAQFSHHISLHRKPLIRKHQRKVTFTAWIRQALLSTKNGGESGGGGVED